MPPAEQLLVLHVEALYRLQEGRITAINQWDGGRVPRLHVGATPSGAQAWYREDLPPALVDALAEVVATEPGGRPDRIGEYETLLARHGPVTERREGPTFALPTDAGLPAAEATVSVSAVNASLLRAHLADWLPDVERRTPFIAALAGDTAVAVCASARETAASCEAGVATAEPFRRAGFASRAVAGWADAVRASGRLPLYSTSWDNVASQALAARLGFEPFGAEVQLF